MDKSSELDCYLYFMWNKWNEEECETIFKANSKQIWRGWELYRDRNGHDGAPAPFYAELTKSERKKIVERAVAYYNS